MLKSEQDILKVIQNDSEMMAIINAAQTMQLPDWWICAGFVRSKIWDVLHEFKEPTIIDDVDVVYFDPNNLEESIEKDYEQRLKKLMPSVPWSVKNEARMHHINNLEPYKSTVDAIAKFPETVTSLGVKRTEDGEILLVCPHGVTDVLSLTVRPTPFFKQSEDRMKIYHSRIHKKNWKSKWYKVTYFTE
ncbi:nucleotidyltransferase family protein [Ornithinibacillus bavariensis]|uniref:Nucleotidyltransferase family protein n=1 Tax=Ornithinibacillus bavariensis TaxID=545502 RepID=A0A919X4M8_9BACI|nr:nucleotidyltransferase family protein [Ornithinibacillus bavariensis]GIO25609.1 hypothetical protein J43TS3_02200 [Ornithinibacillus bavariensis]